VRRTVHWQNLWDLWHFRQTLPWHSGNVQSGGTL
jgi:hypothetical protein